MLIKKTTAFANQENRLVKSTNNNNRKICIYCNKTRHTINVCFKKHGFPPDNKFYNNKPGQVHNTATQNNTKLDQDQSPIETIQIMTQQYQILAKLFKQSQIKRSNVQINQVGTISIK